MLRILARWKTTILAVSAVLFVGLLLSRHLVGPQSSPGPAVGPIPAHEADGHVGEQAQVCGTVVEGTHVSEIGGEPTFLNLGDAHPNQDFTVVIWASDRPKWSTPPETLYEGQSVCITGSVEMHDGTAQIIASSPRHIQGR